MGRNSTIATAILGVWLGITVSMWFAAGRSFATVERVLRDPNPEFTARTRPLEPSTEREVLRHLVSEINRTFFGAYNWIQVVLGALLLLLLFRQTPRDPLAVALAGTMLGLVLVLTLVITPQIASLGRSLDFVPRNPPPSGMGRFRVLHGAYTGLDGVKLLIGLGLLIHWTW